MGVSSMRRMGVGESPSVLPVAELHFNFILVTLQTLPNYMVEKRMEIENGK